MIQAPCCCEVRRRKLSEPPKLVNRFMTGQSKKSAQQARGFQPLRRRERGSMENSHTRQQVFELLWISMGLILRKWLNHGI